MLEESLRGPSSLSRNTSEGRSITNGSSRRQSLGGADNMSKLTSNGFLSKRTPTRSLSSSTSTVLKHAKGTSKSFDGGTRSLDRGSKALLNGPLNLNQSCDATKESETPNTWKGNLEEKSTEFPSEVTEDSVPGVLYDLLQKEVVALRKSSHEKDQSLKDKDDAIEVYSLFYLFEGHLVFNAFGLHLVSNLFCQMLAKKVETLSKAMEVEAKKMRREVAAMEKEVAAMRVEKEHENRAKRFSNSKSSAQLLPGRYVPNFLSISGQI